MTANKSFYLCDHNGFAMRCLFRNDRRLAVYPNVVLIWLVGITNVTDVRADGPYCGVYGAYGALRSVGLARDLHVDALVDQKYIGSPSGSTIDELHLAIQDHGGYALALQEMTVATLTSSPYPVILHTATDGQLATYDHWTLYMGTEDGLVRIVHGSRPPQKKPLAWILSRWDGVGLVVAREPVNFGHFSGADWNVVFKLLAFGVVVVASLYCVLMRLRRSQITFGFASRPIAAEVIAILGAAISVGVAAHLISEIGFFRNKAQVHYMYCALADDAFPDVTHEELSKMLANGDVLVIDARSQAAYEPGHINGALNLPARSSEAARRNLVKAISNDIPVVLYCQSKYCRFAEQIGLWLASEGFREIQIYRGGWVEWLERQDS